MKTDKVDPPQPLSSWSGLPFAEADAVVNPGAGKAYFFRGNQYVRYDVSRNQADAPQPIDSHWK